MSNKCTLFSIILTLSFLQYSCLSFKGVSIPDDIKTYNVSDFIDRSNGPIPNLDIEFSNKMRDEIRQNSRLINNIVNPDIIFEGEIVQAKIISISPSADNIADHNQLVIKVKVNYYSNKDPEIGFEKTFQQFGDFPSTGLLIDFQDQLVEEIFDLITEQVFNEAFTNW